ncbi:MAG TPA: hypothetical protein VMQ83_07310 [Gammaproteobacteria bacterium]|nr:hypothetical protein [Gammaproteobacteria bacterium]
MQTSQHTMDSSRYARCVEVSKRIRWEIDRDVICGREFDFSKKFLPDGLSKVDEMDFLSTGEQRLVSQIQGRTYANIFGLVERFINAKVLEISRDHWLGDQVALEALIRFSEEELKHQELFRRIEAMIGAEMPAGYVVMADPNAVAEAVLSKCTWAVLALTCHIELFTQTHYRQSIEPDANLSELYKDVFLYHWREESQHAVIDELEWRREHAGLDAAARDQGVDDLIALVGAVDGILQAQSQADAGYFVQICGRPVAAEEAAKLQAAMLRAYRWQYIVSGVQEPRFAEILGSMITPEQGERIGTALAPILA